MKVLLVNGSPIKDGCCERALEEVVKALSANGVESEIFWIGNKPLGGCMRNINEENKVPAELVRHPDEENTVAQDDLAPRGKDEENARPDETKRGDEENQIRSKDEKVEPETKKKKQYNPKKVASVSHAVSASLASVAIVLVVASVVLIGQNFFKKAPTYTVNSISYVDNASGNGIAYDITVSTNPDKVPLLLKSVYQDNLGREKDSESLDITEAKNYKGILPSMS